MTRMGSSSATTDMTALKTSSIVLSTGAANPAVAMLAAGRTAVLPRCTVRASRIPITIGTHALLVKNLAGSVTVAVCAAVPDPKTMPPAAGRTMVWIQSLIDVDRRDLVGDDLDHQERTQDDLHPAVLEPRPARTAG